MLRIRTSHRISTYHFVLFLALFAVAGIVVVAIVNYALKREALLDAREKAMIILDRNLSTHTYFTHHLKPAVFRMADAHRASQYFEPTWMSSTYAVREVHKYFRSLGHDEYYYKECAVNARSPENEADASERDFIKRLNTEPQLVEDSRVRLLDGKPFFVVMRRGEVLEESCLRCHSAPKNAPGDLVRTYGTHRSFGRSVGEVVSAVSIRIPLDLAYAEADRLTALLSALLLLVLGVLFLAQLVINRRLIFDPLERIRGKAVEIAGNETALGGTIDPVPGKEMDDLTSAFNTMSRNLLKGREQLEEKVQQRTAELKQALDNVKRLSGMLPICSHCKKIRDDEGYWRQVEVYIRDHSDAEFTHGICPDCVQSNYPELFKNTNDHS